MANAMAAQAAIEELERRHKARGHFREFIPYVCPWYSFNWHHRLMADILERWAFGDIQRLMIFMPPRHGKTENVSKILPSYIFGRMPDAEVMLCSYSDTLASEANADCQKYIDSERYRKLFPNTTLAGRAGRTTTGAWLRNNDEFQIVGHRGRFRSAPIGGQITGKGFTHGIIDDPFKPLAADCPVPTPAGWTTMGELRVGDTVFDHAGVPCRVVALTKRFTAKRHRVWFSDGNYVDSHPNHIWTAFDRQSHGVYNNGTNPGKNGRITRYGAGWWRWRAKRGKSAVRRVTTGEIAATLASPKNPKIRNWTIPCAGPLELPHRELLIDPYILGYWLGDGTSRGCEFTVDKNDLPEFEENAVSCGFYVNSIRGDGGESGAVTVAISTVDGKGHKWQNDSLLMWLRKTGVLNNKHVPAEYLRGSPAQRLDLLRGLMDSDGGAGDDGECVFVNKNRGIADAVAELVVSLGGKCTTAERENDFGFYYTVSGFYPFIPFRLRRKSKRCVLPGQIRRVNRTIESVEVLGETEHLCITVDAESHMFLAGRGMVPTCNSRKDAESFARRQEVDSWYQSTFRSRKQTHDAREIMILTRWHESDLAGRIIKRMKETPLADQWAIVKMPAIRTQDDCAYDPRPFGAVLWPKRHSLASVQATKATIDPYEWASVYQQEPAPRGGSIIMEHWLNPVLIKWRFGRQFFVIGADEQGNGGKWFAFARCAWFQCIDTAQTKKSTSDYTVIGTFALLPNGHMVIWHIFRARLSVPEQFPAIVRMARGCPPRPYSAYGGNFATWRTVPFAPWPRTITLQAIEPKSSGTGLIDQGAASGLPLRALDVDGDKVRRAGPVSVMASRGMVHYNPDAKGDWLEEFVAEVTMAPNSANDDQFDVLAYAGQLALYDEIIRAGVVNLDADDDGATGSEPGRRESYTVDIPGGALEIPDDQ